MRLDTARSRATPEGVNLSLRVAGAPVRCIAWFVDLVLIAACVFFVQLILTMLGTFGTGLMLIFLFCITWFYGVLFELWNDGMTPGKKMLGLRVVHDDGTPVTATGSLLRNFLRVADFLPAAYGAGLVALFLSPNCQRLGDLAAGTLVVYRDDDEILLGLGPGDAVTPSGRPAARPIAPPVALSRSEQRALVDFAARLPTWGGERAAELAAVLRPLTRAGGAEGVDRLVGMAHYVLGRRSEGRSDDRIDVATGSEGGVDE